MSKSVSKPIRFRSRFKPSISRGIEFTESSRTKQAFLAECDINTIMARYQKTGLLTHVNRHAGNYGDFTKFQDYQSSLNQVIDAQSMFSSLPATLRYRFGNDPGQFLLFVSDPKNADEMVKLGLAKPSQKPKEEPNLFSATPPKGKGGKRAQNAGEPPVDPDLDQGS